jgi:Tfp pilus assembly protein PilN
MAKKSAQNKGVSINLLHPQGFPQRLPLQFLKWLINYGRFIVIFVEIIVLVAFVYRFKLDSDLAALKEEINTNVPYIESLSKDEALIKQTHQRLSIVSTVYGKNSIWSPVLDKVRQYLPDNTRINSLNINLVEQVSHFKITAQTSANNDISTFLNNLKKDTETFQNVQLTGLSFDQGNIVFTITGDLK